MYSELTWSIFLFVWCIFVSGSASDCLGRLISKMNYCMLRGDVKFYSLTHSYKTTFYASLVFDLLCIMI